MTRTAPTTEQTSEIKGGGRAWALRAVGLMVMCFVSWSLASPVGAAPDEAAHLAYSWGLASGQGQGVLDPEFGYAVYDVAPGTMPEPGCFAFKPQVSAGCFGFLGDKVGSTAHRYTPALPLVVGTSMRAAHGMVADDSVAVVGRLVAAGVSAALVGASLVVSRHRPALVAAIFLSLTPMTLFIGASVNPNGPAIAGAIAVASGFATVHAARSKNELAGDQRWAWVTAIGGVAWMSFSHPFAIVWAWLLVGFGWLSLSGVPGRSARPAEPRWAWAAIATALGLGSLWFLYYLAGPVALGTAELTSSPPGGLVQGPISAVGNWITMLDQVLGILGWLDTPLPVLARLLVAACWVTAAVLIARHSTRLQRRRVGILLYASFLLPTLAMLYQNNYWQGRYALPAIAATLIFGATSLQGEPARKLLRLAQVSWVVTTGSMLWVWARFAFGLRSGPFDQWVPDFGGGSDWSPVVTAPVLMVLAALCLLFGLGVLESERLRAGRQ